VHYELEIARAAEARFDEGIGALTRSRSYRTAVRLQRLSAKWSKLRR